MRLTEAEIKSLAASVARARSNGCSRSYNRIKQELEQQLKEDNDEPPPEQDMIPPPFENPCREVEFAAKFLAIGFLTIFVLMTIMVIYFSIAEALA